MPLGTPIDELILQNIKTTVAAITAGATYANTVAACALADPDKDPPITDMNVIIGMENPELAESRPFQSIGWEQQFWISCDCVESTASSTSILTRLNSARADIETALMADHTRGSRGTTEVLAPEYRYSDRGSKSGIVVVNIKVKYRTAYNDPRTLIG